MALQQKLVLEQEPETVFNIAGEGPEKEHLQELAAKEGVGERVRFLGFVEDVGKLLGDSRMLVRSSRWEGLPIVIISDWMEVTEESLHQKYQEMSHKIWDLSKLFMPYWLDKIMLVQEMIRKTQ